jgi:hypothetical protein
VTTCLMTTCFDKGHAWTHPLMRYVLAQGQTRAHGRLCSDRRRLQQRNRSDMCWP